MTLTPGQRLGHYEILGHLDKGGMGEVYRARDTKLGREVAIKVLKDERTEDHAWLDRFEREARLLASFVHPHIATLHGLEDVDGVRFLVMELVLGQTLAKRLEGGPLPLGKALLVCRQIAEAIETAHEKGIIHRDLKPGNVMITEQGQVKVLDFGLAASVEPAPGSVVVSGTTQTYTPGTAIGTLLGTAPYMSPEQARGEPVGKRCDVWAFGCILYETLCGKRAFPGKTHTDILAAVIERDPDWQALPPDTPRRVVGLIRRCLQKEERDRQRDIGDARLEIEEILAERKEPAPATKPSGGRGRFLVALGVVALVVVAAFALGLWTRTPQEKPADTPRGWSGELLLGGTTRVWGARVSPNGQWLAFVVLHNGNSQVGVMRLDSGESRVLTHDPTRGSVLSVCWSNESSLIYYDRHCVTPMGIHSVSPVLEKAKDNSSIIDEAQSPQVMNDRSLLVVKQASGGNLALWRHWEDGSQEPRQVLDEPIQITGDEVWWPVPLRPLHRKNKAVFCGKLLDGTETIPQRRLYLIDLDTKKKQRLYPEPIPNDLVSLAVAPDDSYVYLVWPAGDLRQIVRIPLEGGPAEPVFPLLNPVYGLDMDKQGRLFVDQFRRPPEILRFDPKGGVTERIASLSEGQSFQPLELPVPDRPFLLPSRVSGRDRLLLKSPGKDPTPRLDSVETRTPAVWLGEDKLAFVAVQEKGARLMLGRIQEDGVRVDGPLAANVPVEGLTALTASRNGKELYYVHLRKVWAVPADGSQGARALGDGDGIAVHPNGKEVVVQQLVGQGVLLFRVPLPDGPRQKVDVMKGSSLRLASVTIGGQSIDKQGRMLVATASPDNWFWRPALLDLDDPKLEQRIPVDYEGDIYPANWGNDGKVIGLGQPVYSDLWRFTPRP